jgi:ribosomal protein S18 acetylase RimI-like enzyme
VVAGRDVHCLTAVTQVLCHHGYEPGDVDHTDLRVLSGATGVSLAPPYGVPGGEVVIRLARPTDLAAMTLVWADASRTAYRPIFPTSVPPPSLAALLRVWERSVEHPGCQVFVAATGEQVVGTVLVERNADGTGDFARLYVHPSRWDAGIGRALYDVALESLRAAQVSDVRLWVLVENGRAREWYEREGWTATGERQEVVAAVEEVRYRFGLGSA